MEDYITEILVRLSEKSLCRLKLVSKKWNQFITYDPCFRKIYDSRNKHNRPYRMLGLHCRCDTMRYISHFEPTCDEARSLPRLNHTHQLFRNIVLDSSNGFSLCFQEQNFEKEEEPQISYYIYNPITQGRFNLPTPKVDPNARIRDVVSAFICKGKPHLSHPQYYKVIRAVDIRTGYQTLTVEILSSDCDQMQGWKKFEIRCSPHIYFPKIHEPGIISNKTGFVYLQAYPHYVHPQQPEKCGFKHLIVFDDRQQKHSSSEYVLIPNEDFHRYLCYENCSCKSKYGQVNGLIVYLSYCTVGHYLELWELDEDTKEWDLQYRLLNLKIKNEKFFVLAFHPLDRHILLMQIDRETVWFNVESKTMEFISQNVHPMIEFCLPYIWPSWSPTLFKKVHQTRKRKSASSLESPAQTVNIIHYHYST